MVVQIKCENMIEIYKRDYYKRQSTIKKNNEYKMKLDSELSQ
jgi:hypothetical protein